MYFSEFKDKISQLKKRKLGGAKSHEKIMNLVVRQQIFKNISHRNKAKDSSVLCLVYPDKNNKSKLVFILRKKSSGHHSGQIAFPGGKSESFDKNSWQTALREAEEEVGIKPDKIIMIKKLTPVYIPVSNYKVQAFLGYTNQRPDFVKQEEEVEEILEFPLIDFINNRLLSIEKTYFGKTFTLYAFQSGKWKIWGATAMILSEIVDLLE